MIKTLVLLISIVSLFVTTRVSQAVVFFEDSTLEELQAREKEIGEQKKSLPENQSQLERELEKVESEISSYTKQSFQKNNFEEIKKMLAKKRDDLLNYLKSSSEIDCNKDSSKLERDSRLILTYYPIHFRGSDDVDFGQLIISTITQYITSDYNQMTCENLKNAIANLNPEKMLLDDFNTKMIEIQQNQSTDLSKQDILKRLLSALRDYHVDLQKKLNSTSPQEQVGSLLIWIIVAIGAFSVLTIAAVKLFEYQLQMEWVASGQVIQFVTVSILLSVILALGLAQILKENTLGTLLGGLAGYVLAQGVGRTVAREASQATRQQVSPNSTTVAHTSTVSNTDNSQSSS